MWIKKEINDWYLKNFLENESSNDKFDDPLLREILLQSYPYEIEHKFLWKKIENDEKRNTSIINLFNRFFSIDFDEIMNAYNKRTKQELHTIREKSSRLHQETFEERNLAVDAYFNRLYSLLKEQWFHDEMNAIKKFREQHMIVRYEWGISWVTFSEWEKIIIEVWNDTYVTLFHELTHLISKYFRFTYYWNHEVCFDNYTKTNEWLANYVAYHLFDGIISWNKNCIKDISHDELFYSPYIWVYALLREKWSDNKETNFSLVKEFMEEYEWSLLTEEKAKFYFERFYKFFWYNQHEYFYPKELLYYLWYNQIRTMMKESSDSTQLLTQLLLWKLCLQ